MDQSFTEFEDPMWSYQSAGTSFPLLVYHGLLSRLSYKYCRHLIEQLSNVSAATQTAALCCSQMSLFLL
jgi:hypothetical protein